VNNLNNWPAADVNDPKVIVASSKGYNTTVTGIRVGQAFDTIRTRREDLMETYGATLAVV
jgi:hypothetical protein